MADMRPSYGLLLTQIWQTGVDRSSSRVIPHGVGQIKVSDVGLIWASGILISGKVMLDGSGSAFS